jgi:DNA replication protein DnaC
MSAQTESLLKELKLHTIRATYRELAATSAKEGLTHVDYLTELMRRESEARRTRRVERLLIRSGLPLEKTLETLDLSRLGLPVATMVKDLIEGDFLARKENVLAFGRPGSGKTHLLCAVGQALVRKGHAVLFASSSLLVQRLLRAKTDLTLEACLKSLARFEAIIIDDLGYVQQSREEMEVLFTLLAHRYERASLMITSNLPFSKWEQIFKDPMTTAAAIDRLVHHSIILELNASSYRVEAARKGQKRGKK